MGAVAEEVRKIPGVLGAKHYVDTFYHSQSRRFVLIITAADYPNIQLADLIMIDVYWLILARVLMGNALSGAD